MSDVDEIAVQKRLGAKIKARREKLGLSQGDLAERSHTHRTYVSQVENGLKGVTIGKLAHISSALSTTPSALTQGILSDGDEETEHPRSG
jgi:transcriptional regulator with XRE-family HTH domain